MKKGLAVLFCSVMIVSGASAALVPKNMTINLNLNLKGIFGGEKKKQPEQEENNTYGKRVGGQSVYTETRSNNPPERRNTDDMRVTNEDTATHDPLLKFISGIFGN